MRFRDTRIDADERLRRRLAAVVALLLNLVFLIALDQVMRPMARERALWARVEPANVLQVRLIEAVPSPAPAVEAPPMPPASEPAAAPARVAAPIQRRSRARSARQVEADVAAASSERNRVPEESSAPAASSRAEPSPAPQFYDRDGRVRLPDAKAFDAETPFPQLPIVPTEGNPFVHRSPLPYEPTRFDKYFPDVRETLGGELVRKSIVKRSGRLPWGTYVECTWILIFGGCNWGSAPTATIEELKAMRADPPMPKKDRSKESAPESEG